MKAAHPDFILHHILWSESPPGEITRAQNTSALLSVLKSEQRKTRLAFGFEGSRTKCSVN